MIKSGEIYDSGRPNFKYLVMLADENICIYTIIGRGKKHEQFSDISYYIPKLGYVFLKYTKMAKVNDDRFSSFGTCVGKIDDNMFLDIKNKYYKQIVMG